MTEPTSVELDIIVPTHGRLDLSIQCIKALFANTRVPFHLIVVDDSNPEMDEGTDLTPEWFAPFCKAHSNVTFVHSDEPFKSSHQLFSLAFTYCKTPYVAIVVNSVTVEPDWESEGLQLMRSNPEIGMIGFKCLRQGTGVIESAGIAAGIGGTKLLDMGGGEPSHKLTTNYECDAVQWAFVLLRREAVEGNLGDDIYNGFKGLEDLETCFTVREKGWKIYYCGYGVGYHQKFATRMARSQADIVKNQQNREIFYKKWGFWELYHLLNPELGEFFPDMKPSPGQKVEPVKVIAPRGRADLPTKRVQLNDDIRVFVRGAAR